MTGLKLQAQVDIDRGKLNLRQNPHKALLDSIPQNGFKCDLMFWAFKYRIGEEKESLRKLPYVYQFNITKDKKHIATWTLDLRFKNSDCEVYKAAPPIGVKTDCELTVDDDDLLKIIVGKLNPQRAFLLSRLKIRGNIMLMQKLYSIWYDFRRKGKTKELDLIQDIIVDVQLVPNLKSEAMAIELIHRIVKLPLLSEQINGVVRLDVLKDKQLVAHYWIGLFPSGKPEFRREVVDRTKMKADDVGVVDKINSQNSSNIQRETSSDFKQRVNLVYTLEDDDLVLILYGVLKVDQAIAMGRLKVDGPSGLAEKVKNLLERPPVMCKL